MASINEINKYYNKYIILKKDLSIAEKNTIDSIETKLEDIYLRNKDDILADISIEFLQTMYYYTIFYFNNKKEKIPYLYGYIVTSALSLLLDYYNIYAIQNRFLKNLSSQGQILLMMFACNRFELIEPCYPKIVESILNGNMSRSLSWGGDGRGNVVPPRPQRLGVLAIEMMASERKQSIDWDGANIPIDLFYHRFCQEVLYSTDENELTDWLIKLCDNHLEWISLFLDNDEKQPATGYEIDDIMLFLWPFEYQAVKNFRIRHGLSTPEIDHPLLKTPMAIDHLPNFATWQKPMWYNKMVDKVIEVNPELSFIRELFNS
ncbi:MULTISPECIES: hypothetical protein [unclassified Gilliamella]|uniref:hypothetical protein n=1 Tax=unclassified Gilliamella TaxID=2685620 RepID=UPI0018DB40FA|nr:MULTISPECIES: hypothetical protein [unclassified Gilliamella]MBI0113721.1 hypothetical protein [Gilliamella sp. W8123]MBI0117290.1 hypothetical protein [Gilliamella sp. W8129]